VIVKKVLIKNFRNLVECEVELNEFTTIVGMNNAGKTNFLLALDKVLGPRSPRAVRIDNSDFADPTLPIVVDVTLSNLKEDDIASFHDLPGLINPTTQTVKIHFESRWQEQEREVFSECYIIRDDLEEDEQRVADFTTRFKRYIPFSTIPAHREVEREIGPSRRGGLQGVVRAFAGDFVRPLDVLGQEIKELAQDLRNKVEPVDATLLEAVENGQNILEQLVENSVTDWTIARQEGDTNNQPNEQLNEFSGRWQTAAQAIAAQLGQLDIPEPEHASISSALDHLKEKVTSLVRRCTMRLSLSSLREMIEETNEFGDMKQELCTVVGTLIPDCDVDINLFPVQDDDLLQHTLIELGGFPLLAHGSGYQSSFVLGVRVLVAIVDILRASTGQGVKNCILAIEEPEAHWHPHLQRHLVNGLKQLQEKWADRFSLQIILTTHSSHVVSRAAPSELIIFRLSDGQTSPVWLAENAIEEIARELEPDDDKSRGKKHRQLQKWLYASFERHSEVFFARSVLLFEGETEEGALPTFAKKMSADYDFDRNGVTALTTGGDGQITYAVKLLQKFDSTMVVIYDKDNDQNRLLDIVPDAFPSDARNFEGEILQSMPLHKIIDALAETCSPETSRIMLTEHLHHYRDSLKAFQDLEELAEGVRQGQIEDDLGYVLGQVKKWLAKYKGFQLGRALADRVEDEEEIPQVYRNAIRRVVELAQTS
jgi:predicted ATP-dependent endonuclease of OLD family